MEEAKTQTVMQRFFELLAEYVEDRHIINRGHPLTPDNQLQRSLDNVTHEIRGVLKEDIDFTEDDVALLCADEAKKACTEEYALNDYAHTLYEHSLSLLSLIRSAK